jgi:hypothetical protein
MTTCDERTPEEQIASLKRALDAAVEHAQAYRGLFFDQQDQNDTLRAELAANRSIRQRQRQIIADLEKRLGIDDEL